MHHDGSAVLLLNNPGPIDFARQTLNINGSSGAQYALTLYLGGKNAPTAGNIGGRIELLTSGRVTTTQNCLYTGSRGTFSWQPGSIPAPNTDGENSCLEGYEEQNGDPSDGCEVEVTP